MNSRAENRNPKVDAFLSKAKKWREEMEKLRALLLASGLTEELKWGKPCYSLNDANVVLILPFKETCALLFCKGALLKDPKGILYRPSENTQAQRQLRLTSAGEIGKLEPTLKAYIREAIDVEKAGLEVTYKKINEYSLPEELEQKFQERPDLKTAFEALTPGRQRGYLLHFSGAKQSATRASRIEKCMPQIFAGKGHLEPPAKTDAKAKTGGSEAKPAKAKKLGKDGVVLLSGGNPQIAKGDGDAPVQAYIAAMPGWKSDLGKRLDALISRQVPGVSKAVKWNSPFYGIDGRGWFVTFHVLTRYVKVTFFKGVSLKPMPPGSTERSGESRWIDIYEDDKFDEKQMAAWIKQAAKLPGWIP